MEIRTFFTGTWLSSGTRAPPWKPCVWKGDRGDSFLGLAASWLPADPEKTVAGSPTRGGKGRMRLRADTQRCWLKEARGWLSRLSSHCFLRRLWWESGHLGERKEGRKQAELEPALDLALLWSSEVGSWLKGLTVGQPSEFLGFREGLWCGEVIWGGGPEGLV